MADVVVETDDDGGSNDEVHAAEHEVEQETQVEHAHELGSLEARCDQHDRDIEELKAVTGGLALAVDGLDDRVTFAVQAAFDAQMTAGEAKVDAEQAETVAEVAVEAAAETVEEESEPPPPDDAPGSKKHAWWR